MRAVDVLHVADFRLSAGMAAGVAEEIPAEVSAGWRSGLVQLNGPRVATAAAIDPRIRRLVTSGSAQLLVGRDPVRTQLALIHDPEALGAAADHLPPIHADRVLVVAGQEMLSPDTPAGLQPRRIGEIVRARFGRSPCWAPKSAETRRRLLTAAPGLDLIADDWVDIIDSGPWSADRPRQSNDRLVIGRHGHDHDAMWPRTRSELEAVYPTDGSVRVEILGGVLPAAKLLGPRLPPSWRVWSWGARESRDFLRGLDAYVYYLDPRLAERDCQHVLEAMAAGIPVMLPPALEPLFGDAALYADPSDTQRVVRELHGDPELRSRVSHHARQVVASRFSPQVHRDRVEALTGLRPSRPLDDGAERSLHTTISGGLDAAAATTSEQRPRLLLISSNGTGMGHLMRLMAYGRRATEFEPHVLSLSQGVAAAGALGMPFEYVPSAATLQMSTRRWQPIFTARVGAALDRIRPSVVVFDGTWPYSGIGQLRASHPDPIWVWSRRGMWREERGGEQLGRSVWFDEILEPGDFAYAADTGATATEPSIRVPPVTLLDADELLDRTAARRALGLPEDEAIALVSFSGGAVEDVTSDTTAAISCCRQLGLQVCVTQSVVSPYVVLPDDVHVVNPIPLATYQRAFDVAISSAGYNSFHELLRFGTPTLFIPKRNTSFDDQARRARWAAEQGWASYADRVTESGTVRMLTDLLDDGASMVAKVAAVDPGNGAADAARLLAGLHAGSTA